MSRIREVELGGPGGERLVARLEGPRKCREDEGRAGLLLAHGAGSDWDEPALAGIAQRLGAAGHHVLLLRWPYRARAADEGRRRPPERLPRLLSQLATALGGAREQWPELPWFVGGRSLGARVSAHLAAGDVLLPAPPAGLLCLAYPLTPPRAARPRPTPFGELAVPALLVQGGRDPFGGPEALAAALGETRAPVELLPLPLADHALLEPRRGGRPPGEVLDGIAAAVDTWLRSAPGRQRP